MSPLLKLLTWTAVVALPGGVLLLPVLVADRVAQRRKAAAARAAAASAG